MRYLSLFILVLSLSACEFDVDVPFPEHKPKIVMYGLVETDQAPEIYLAKSKGILDNSSLESQIIKDATVSLYEGELMLGEMVYRDTTFWIFDDNNFSSTDSVLRSIGKYTLDAYKMEAGKTYTVKVSHPDFEAVEAITQIANRASIGNIEFDLEAATVTDPDGYTYEESSLTVEINDPPGEENFYKAELNISVKDSSGITLYEDHIYYLGASYSGVGGAGGHVIDGEWWSDSNFDGQNFNALFVFDQPYLLGENNNEDYVVTLKATIYSANRDVFLHLDKVNKQREAAYSGIEIFPPEAIVLYSNVKNGYGVFGGLNVDEIVIR